ncbi:MAG: O-antigen ligase family protein [Nitrospira sp.]|nr:O-antigen ligase family protein [Nitrospira sp.]
MSDSAVDRTPSYFLNGTCLVIGALTIFVPLIEGGTTQLPVLIIRLVLLAVLGVWLVHGIRDSALSIPQTSLWWPVAAFSGLAWLSLFWSTNTNVSLQWCLSILLYVVFFGIVLQAADSEKRVRGLFWLILAMGVFEGGTGILQYCWSGEARAKGTFFNPNFFATYEAVTAVLALSVLLTGMEWRRTEKLLLALIAIISGTAVLLAQSRGATAAFLLAVTFVGVARFGKVALIVLVIVVVSGIIVPNPLKERIKAVSIYDPYAYSRVEIWKGAIDRVIDHPMGLGLGAYKYASFQYRFPIEGAVIRYGKRAETAHNEYLQLAAELGVAGLVLFLIGIGVWVSEARKVMKGTLSQQHRGIMVGLCAGVLAILIHAAVDSVFHEPALVLLLILLGGLVLALKNHVGHPGSREWRLRLPYHPTRVVLAGVVVAALAILVIRPAAAWFMVEYGNKAVTGHDDLGAIQWYRYAALVDPASTAVRDGLARFYVQQFRLSGDPEWLRLAAEEIEVGMSFNALDGRMPYRLGTIYALMAEQRIAAPHREVLLAQAEQALEKAITVDPFSPFGYFELGILLRGQGDHVRTRQLLEQAIRYEPNFVPARVVLADLAKEAGQAAVADAHVRAIRAIRSRYQGWTLTPTEQQFLGMAPPNS